MTIFEHLPGLSVYDLGRTPSTAVALDQRFSYCLYVPRTARADTSRVLVAVHGTERGNQGMRDLFIPLAEKLGLIVLAPLFPCGIHDPLDRDNYKYIAYRDIRFDHILLGMVDEVARRYGFENGRFSLFGFSGGAHFVHRFFYLHPRRLEAVSICSPGSPTLLDPARPWWTGVSDMEQRFGRPLDLDAMRAVRVHLAVGRDDLDSREITHQPGGPHWMEGANDAGCTRVERLHSLDASLRDAGIETQFDLLPGVRHERDRLAESAIGFFETALGAVNVAA